MVSPDSVDVEGLARLAKLSESAILGVVGAAILESAILVTPSPVTPSASIFFLLLCRLVRLVAVFRGSCQVISYLTICFPSVRRQTGRPTIGRLLIARAKSSGISIAAILVLCLVALTLTNGRLLFTVAY